MVYIFTYIYLIMKCYNPYYILKYLYVRKEALFPFPIKGASAPPPYNPVCLPCPRLGVKYAVGGGRG